MATGYGDRYLVNRDVRTGGAVKRGLSSGLENENKLQIPQMQPSHAKAQKNTKLVV
jgi:hypothetical protein